MRKRPKGPKVGPVRRLWERFRRSGPKRPSRVTDDDDDGLAGARVPKRPYPPQLVGAGARAIPPNDEA